MNIPDAERAIAAILAQVEAASDGWIEGVEVVSTEVTNMRDTRQRYSRAVRICVRPRPGTEWQT